MIWAIRRIGTPPSTGTYRRLSAAGPRTRVLPAPPVTFIQAMVIPNRLILPGSLPATSSNKWPTSRAEIESTRRE